MCPSQGTATYLTLHEVSNELCVRHRGQFLVGVQEGSATEGNHWTWKQSEDAEVLVNGSQDLGREEEIDKRDPDHDIDVVSLATLFQGAGTPVAGINRGVGGVWWLGNIGDLIQGLQGRKERLHTVLAVKQALSLVPKLISQLLRSLQYPPCRSSLVPMLISPAFTWLAVSPLSE